MGERPRLLDDTSGGSHGGNRSPGGDCLPAAALEAAPLVLLGGGALRGLMSWTGSFGAGSEGVDSISRNFTNISEKDCNNRCYGEEVSEETASLQCRTISGSRGCRAHAAPAEEGCAAGPGAINVGVDTAADSNCHVTCTEQCVSTFVSTLQICWIMYDRVFVATPSRKNFFMETRDDGAPTPRREDRQGVTVSYRVERLAAGRPLGSGGDTLRPSASEPARHPPGDTVPAVLLQHLQMNIKKRRQILLSL